MIESKPRLAVMMYIRYPLSLRQLGDKPEAKVEAIQEGQSAIRERLAAVEVGQTAIRDRLAAVEARIGATVFHSLTWS